jgi:hypothetical protein
MAKRDRQEDRWQNQEGISRRRSTFANYDAGYTTSSDYDEDYRGNEGRRRYYRSNPLRHYEGQRAPVGGRGTPRDADQRQGPLEQGGRYTDRTADWQTPGPMTGRGPKGYEWSDERIREEVCHRLNRHGLVDATGIEVEVMGGEVTLNGTVNSRRAKRMAEDTTDSVPGIRDIHNRLRIEDAMGGSLE